MENNNAQNFKPPASEIQEKSTEINPNVQAEIKKPKKYKKLVPIIIFLTLILILFTGMGILGFSTYNKEKDILKQACNSQVSNTRDLERQYADIMAHLRKSEVSEEQEKQSSFGTLLGAEDINLEPKEITETENVLGLEDSPVVEHTRTYIEMLRNALNTVEDIEKENQEIEGKIDSFSVYGKFIGEADVPTEKTDEFVQKTKPLLTYLKDIENYSIKAIITGYEFGGAVNETILRGADDQSVDKLEKKIEELRNLKDEAAKIDTSKIPADLKKDHAEFIESFDNDMGVFTEILEAMKAKDALKLQKALISLMSEGETANQVGLTEYISFWQENETLRSIENIREEWESAEKS